MGVFENNLSVYHCYKVVGFEDVILDTVETYSVLGEEWKCRELMVEKRQAYIFYKGGYFMKKKAKKVISIYLIICLCLCFTACRTVNESQVAEESETYISEEYNLQPESNEENSNTDNSTESMIAPSKEEVIAMRAVVLDGMSEEEISRLKENIKVANTTMEYAYLNDNIFDKLSDADSPYWQYFDKTGEIQIGWWYNRYIIQKDAIMQAEGITEAEFYEREYEPGMAYNRFDAANFIELIEDMQLSVQNEMLSADLQQLIDLTYMASVTHKMEYANQIYKILHDLDYFLLRYGIEDVGAYTQDKGTVAKYYGVLTVYGATPYKLDETNSYNVLYQETVENDFIKYGEMEVIHEEFQDAEGNVTYYYDMECFYFNDIYPAVLNETLQAYYDSVEEAYIQDAQVYAEPFEEDVNTPCNSLIFQYFTYVDEDYVSLVYNDVCYMGGAHPYSAKKGITIDCVTGEVVDVQQFLDDSDEEIGEQLQSVLGMDVASMDEWDFYLTETSVVFFYYDPKYWDSVAARRVR